MKSFKSNRKFERRDSSRFEGREPRKFDRGERRSSDRFEHRDSGRSNFKKEMHEVVCDKCGQRCEVPFLPTSNKPVYCSDCFRKKEHTDSRRSEVPVRDNSKAELEQINQKLDKILELLVES